MASLWSAWIMFEHHFEPCPDIFQSTLQDFESFKFENYMNQRRFEQSSNTSAGHHLTNLLRVIKRKFNLAWTSCLWTHLYSPTGSRAVQIQRRGTAGRSKSLRRLKPHHLAEGELAETNWNCSALGDEIWTRVESQHNRHDFGNRGERSAPITQGKRVACCYTMHRAAAEKVQRHRFPWKLHTWGYCYKLNGPPRQHGAGLHWIEQDPAEAVSDENLGTRRRRRQWEWKLLARAWIATNWWAGRFVLERKFEAMLGLIWIEKF